MKKLLTLLIAALLMQAAYSQADKDSANLLKVGAEMPEFTLQSLDGKTLSSDDLYGKVVLIIFFATWCVPCNLEMSLVDRNIWAKYKDNSDFVLLVVDPEETAEKVKAFVEKKKWTMPIYLDDQKEVYLKFATKFLQRNYLFDRESRLVVNSNGYNKEDLGILKTEIGNLLNKQN